VSPLWVAHKHMIDFYSEREFPCRFDRLAEFLAIAEFFRAEGQKLKTKQSPTPTILPPTETYRLPGDLKLPPVSIEIVRSAA